MKNLICTILCLSAACWGRVLSQSSQLIKVIPYPSDYKVERIASVNSGEKCYRITYSHEASLSDNTQYIQCNEKYYTASILLPQGWFVATPQIVLPSNSIYSIEDFSVGPAYQADGVVGRMRPIQVRSKCVNSGTKLGFQINSCIRGFSLSDDDEDFIIRSYVVQGLEDEKYVFSCEGDSCGLSSSTPSANININFVGGGNIVVSQNG